MARERRRFPRVLQPFDAHYRFCGDLVGLWRTVRTLNLGAGGMRFRTEDVLEPRAALEIRLNLPIFREPLVLHARVIWCQTLASGVVENGVEFVDTTPRQAEQIDTLVQLLVRPRSPKAPA